MIEYVKFLRGTPSQFEKLSIKDKNTLYFISETDGVTGKLYLGNKLIAGGSDLTNSSIKDLADVIINEAELVDGSVLSYDYVKQAWVAKTLEEVLVGVMSGATSDTNGQSGLVPAPMAGDEGKFLKGDGTWSEVNATLSVEDRAALDGVVSKVEILVGDDANQSVREIALDTVTKALIPDSAQESLDTLKEIADWIQSHPNDVSELNTRITTLETKTNDLDVILNGNAETSALGLVDKVNSLFENDGTSKFVLKSTFNTQVGDFSQLNLSDGNSSIIDEINSINMRISWQDME